MEEDRWAIDQQETKRVVRENHSRFESKPRRQEGSALCRLKIEVNEGIRVDWIDKSKNKTDAATTSIGVRVKTDPDENKVNVGSLG